MSRIDRLEIPKRVKLQVFTRAGGPDKVCCEGCTLRLGGKPFEYHHIRAEWTQTLSLSERAAITAADVRLLCIPCHDAISAKDTTARAHGKRIVEKTARVKRRSSFLTNRDGPFKKRMDGSVERRERAR